MITFKQFLDESINDKGIFKAVFVIGLPGSGKSYTVQQMSGSVSPRVVNTDKAAEFLSSKWQKEIRSDSWAEFKDKAHTITSKLLFNYLNGALPLFIDGTSNDISNVLHRIGILESLGYDVGVVFVKASLDTAMKRAESRAASTGRHVDAEFIKAVAAKNEENAAYLKSKVDFFHEVPNDTMTLSDSVMNQAFKSAQAFFAEPVNNILGKQHIAAMKADGQKYLTPEIIPVDQLEKKIQGWYRS